MISFIQSFKENKEKEIFVMDLSTFQKFRPDVKAPPKTNEIDEKKLKEPVTKEKELK